MKKMKKSDQSKPSLTIENAMTTDSDVDQKPLKLRKIKVKCLSKDVNLVKLIFVIF